MNLFTLFGRIAIDDKGATSKIDNVTNTARRSEKTIGGAFKNIGKIIIAAFSVKALVGFEKKIISTYATYDDQMRKVQAVTGATGEAYQKLRDKAEELGRSTRFSATEAGEGMEALGRAGWNTTQVLDGIGPVLSFATANSIELGSAASIVADGLSQFGMKASQTEEFVDILSATARASNTDIGLLSDTLKYAGPVAGALGYDLKDVSVAMGLMANQGIKGSQAGTSLRGVLTRLAKPTKESAMAMEELGIDIVDAEGNMLSFDEVLINLRNSMKDLHPAHKANLAAMLAGQQGMSGLLAIVNASEKDFNDMTEAIQNSSGATKEMEEIMDGGLGGAIESVKSAWEGLLIKFGEMQDGFLVDIFNKLAEVLQGLPPKIDALNQKWQSLKEFMKENENIIKAIGIAFGIMAVGFKADSLMAGGGIIGLFENIRLLLGESKLIGPVMSGVGSAFTFLTSPVGLITAAIAAFAALAYVVYKNWDTIGPFLSDLWESIKNIFNTSIEWIGNLISTVWTAIANFFVSAWEVVTWPFKMTWEIIKSIVMSALAIIEGIIGTVLGVIQSVWMAIWNSIKDYVIPVWESIKNIVTNSINAVKTVITTVMNIIKNIITKIWNGIKKVTSTVWEGIKTVVTNIVNAIKAVITNVFNAIKSVVTNIWNGIKSVTSSVWNGIKTTITNIVNSIKSTVTNVFNSIKSTTERIFNNVKTAMTKPIEAAKDAIKRALDAIKGFFSRLRLKFPKIERPKLPKFSIKGEFSLKPPSVPRIGVDWFKEGAILTEPTMFGFNPNSGNAMVGGEAGHEAILPIEKLSDILADTLIKLGFTNTETKTDGGNVIVKVNIEEFTNNDSDLDIPDLIEQIQFEVERKLKSRGGNDYALV